MKKPCHGARAASLPIAVLVLAALLWTASAWAAAAGAQGGEGRPYVEGEILVKYRPWVPRAAVEMQNHKYGARRIRSFERLGVHHLGLPEGLSVAEAVRLFREAPEVLYAEPNYVVRPALLPNDADFSEQWYLHNVGQAFLGGLRGTFDADIDAPEAWDVHQAAGAVIVAVVDTGVDYTHPELSANIWTNPGEANCSNGVDDDQNEYADDCRGWNFVSNNNNPMDDFVDLQGNPGHGTLGAGIIGAVGNNGSGIAGINWAVQVMPLKFMNSAGDGTVDKEIQAIYYAIDMGADIINASYGLSGFSTAERDAIQAARDAGILFVAAAGNDGSNNDATAFYPASHDLENIISVAASSYDDTLASFSNYGATSVDLAAPGAWIYSTVPYAAPLGADDFDFASGTSFAAPMVSGAAALVKSRNPSAAYSVIKGVILASVDNKGYPVMTGGRLNLFRAVSTDLGGATPLAPTGLLASAASTSSVSLSWSDNSSNETGFEVERRTGAAAFAPLVTRPANSSSYTDTGLGEATAYSYRVRAVNASGASGYSNEASTVTLPNAPSGLTAQAVSASQIDLAWTDNSSGEDGVRIERSEAGGAFAQVAVTGPNAVAYSDSGLSAATAYAYRVRAFTSGGNSAYSNQASAATDGSAPAGGGGGGGGCFIATAAYGSRLAPEVAALREFRDRYLMTNAPGRALVAFYYRVSPEMADYIRRHPAMRGAARAALAPVVVAARYPGAALALLVCGAAVLVYYRGRRRKRR
ncbi:MAG: hypothetical protein Kow0025_13230 [Thermodesulfovibrionales bacterium]